MPTTTGLATSFITFSRPGASGGGATVTLSNGRIGWAGHNLLTNSESFDASSWTKTLATITPNAIAAPNGTTTADKFLSTNTNTGEMYQNISKEASAITYTTGVFAKAGGFNWLQIAVYDAASTGSRFWFNLSTGAKGSTAAIGSGYTNTDYNIVSIGDGWYYCWVKATTNTGTTNRILFYPANADNTFTAGNGTDGVHLWGAHSFRSDLGGMQLNPAQPAGMQSYYPTTVRNMLGFTEDFSGTGWSRVGLLANGSGSAANVVVNPVNGLQTADLIVESTVTGYHTIYRTITTIANTPYLWSAYVKPAGRTIIQIAAQATANVHIVEFNLTGAGTAITRTGSGTATITALPDGWYRVSTISTATGSGTGYWQLDLCSAANTNIYTGDGVSGIYLWGAQVSDSASLDTYVPQYGAAVTSAAYYAPRLDFDPVTLAAKGLLVEELRTNLLTDCNDFSGWSPSNATVTANDLASPDGTTNADKVVFTGGVTGYIYKSVSIPAITTYTLSFYVYGTAGQTFTPYSESVGGTYSSGTPGTITLTGGWQRVSWQHVAATGNSAILHVIRSQSADTAKTVWVYGAQFEVGASNAAATFPTSLIVTGSATATRTADVASVSTQAFPYSASEGTLVASGAFISLTASSVAVMASLNNNNSTNSVNIYRQSALMQLNSFSGGTNTVTYSVSASTEPVKAAIAYKLNDANAAVNGVAQTTDTTAALPVGVDRLDIGWMWSVYPGNGWIRQITYIPRRLSNAELASRTAA